VKRLSEDTALKSLRDLGLKETEARVYLSLLGGSADAKQLSERAGVPYSKVHTILARLIRGSLVEERRGRPMIYEAKRAEEGLAEYRRQAEEELQRKVKSAEEAINELVMADDSEKPDIWIIRNQEEILKKSYQILNGARSEVKLAMPIAPNWAVSLMIPVLMRLKSEEVSLKILLTNQSEAEGFSKAKEFAEIRVRDKMFGGGVIVDNMEALLFIGSNGPSVSLAIWSNHAGLVQVARTYFDYLWDSALMEGKEGAP